MAKHTIEINRAPVPTLWGAIVVEVKQRPETELWRVSRENRGALPHRMAEALNAILPL
jgi:hypothetical protein